MRLGGLFIHSKGLNREASLTRILELALRQGSRGAGWQLSGMSGSEAELGCDYSGLREKKKAHNQQGDIVGSVDVSGRGMVEYKYGAWGKIVARTGSLVSTLGWLNPFRYRGYAYDEETGLYYLRSRYCNPEWGRFINADVVLGKRGALLSHNLFAYCVNKQTTLKDSKGYMPEWISSIQRTIAMWLMDMYALSNRCNTINRNAIECEIGLGIGVGGEIEEDISGMAGSLMLYNGDYLQLSNGEWRLVNRSGSSASITYLGVTRNLSMPITTYEHEYGAEGCTCSFWDTPMIEKRMCPANVEVPVELYENEDVASWGVEGYFMLGGKLSVSVNLNYLYEEYSKLIEDTVDALFK